MPITTHADEVKKSIVLRTGLALIAIAFTALLSMLGSMMIAETLEGDAAAINLSGSLRMQSYRMTTLRAQEANPTANNALLSTIEEHEQRLYSSVLTQAVKSNHEESLINRVDSLHSEWNEHVKPALISSGLNEPTLLLIVDDYVNDINDLVTLLENGAESKIRTLRAMQGITMFIVILVSFILINRIHEKTVMPLRDLVEVARRIQGGDFNARSYYNDPDELGLLSQTFNQMATELSVLYDNLESRVKRKTAELQRSNDSLRLLYESSRILYANPALIYQSAHDVLNRLQRVTDVGPISLCLSKARQGPAYRILMSDKTDKPAFCRLPNCDECRAHPNKGDFMADRPEVITIPVGSHDNPLGELSVQMLPNQRLDNWQRQLFNAMADVISTTISLAGLGEQEARLALMEERAVIARELHDSLAQSLSYQKLQAARLKKLIERGASTDEIYQAIDGVQQGLNNAYKQLRELLGTFRIKINAPGLEPALIGTVAEFREKNPIDIELRYNLANYPLTPNEEIHCLQIAREALSNVVKHSKADRALISFDMDQQKRVHIEIQDNGIGIPDVREKQNHYGLAILAERTESLRGALSINRRPEGGTQVTVYFVPEHMRSENNQAPVYSELTEQQHDRPATQT